VLRGGWDVVYGEVEAEEVRAFPSPPAGEGARAERGRVRGSRSTKCYAASSVLSFSSCSILVGRIRSE
jgi:hypothetical protein